MSIIHWWPLLVSERDNEIWLPWPLVYVLARCPKWLVGPCNRNWVVAAEVTVFSMKDNSIVRTSSYNKFIYFSFLQARCIFLADFKVFCMISLFPRLECSSEESFVWRLDCFPNLHNRFLKGLKKIVEFFKSSQITGVTVKNPQLSNLAPQGRIFSMHWLSLRILVCSCSNCCWPGFSGVNWVERNKFWWATTLT